MCGRYAASSEPAALVEMFEIERVVDVPPASWNVAPTDTVPAVLVRADRETGTPTRLLAGLRWGLVPSWSKGPRSGPPLINARSETLVEKPSFRTALSKRRCLLPADGYYEWYVTGDTKAGKQPYFIAPPGGRYLMAGLYELWRNPADGEWLTSCTIITTKATDRLGHIHDRMPMSVAPTDFAAWLDPELTDAAMAMALLDGDAQALEPYPVSTLVNKVANNGPELVQPIEVGS